MKVEVIKMEWIFLVVGIIVGGGSGGGAFEVGERGKGIICLQ